MEYLPMYPRYLDDLWIYHVAFAILSNPPLPYRVYLHVPDLTHNTEPESIT